MKHIPYEDWLPYVEDKLEEETRTEYENHMYSCDQCLELYLEAVENAPIQMPVLSSDASFTDSIMLQVKETTKVETKPVKPITKSFRKQTMTHYMVAAAMTLILMSTGIFSQLMTVASALEKTEMEKQTSFVDNILNNTISITNKLEDNFKEGDKK